VHQQTVLFLIALVDLFPFCQQTPLLYNKTMPHALRVNFENFGHTTKNTIFRLVKLLADLSTRLKSSTHIDENSELSIGVSESQISS